MTTKTLRLPDALAAAVREVGASEHLEEAAAMRKLLRLGYERYVACQYRDGHLSLREAAQRLGLSLSETIDALQLLGITGNVGAADTLHSLETLAPHLPS